MDGDNHVTAAPEKARQGGQGRQTLIILTVSLGLTVAGLAALWGGWSSDIGSAGIPVSSDRLEIEPSAAG